MAGQRPAAPHPLVRRQAYKRKQQTSPHLTNHPSSVYMFVHSRRDTRWSINTPVSYIRERRKHTRCTEFGSAACVRTCVRACRRMRTSACTLYRCIVFRPGDRVKYCVSRFCSSLPVADCSACVKFTCSAMRIV